MRREVARWLDEDQGYELLANGLRRAGRFDQARARCHRGLSGRPEEPFRSLLEFELELITSEDTAHSVSEVVGPW